MFFLGDKARCYLRYLQIIHTLLAAFLSCAACSAYSSTIKTEAVCSSETSVNFYQTARYHIPVDCILHILNHENLKSNIAIPFGVTLVKNMPVNL